MSVEQANEANEPEIVLTGARVVRVELGDVLAVVTDRPITMDQAVMIKRRLAATWPDNECVIFDRCEFAVIRRGEPVEVIKPCP